jgi:hypothetical protein
MDIPPEFWAGLGVGSGWALAAYFMRLVYVGKLVPAHDRDEWRAESRIKDTQIAEKDKQLDHLKEVGHAVNAVMRAVQKGASGEVSP